MWPHSRRLARLRVQEFSRWRSMLARVARETKYSCTNTEFSQGTKKRTSAQGWRIPGPPGRQRLGPGGGGCARAPEQSGAATSTPSRAPPRPRPRLKAAITLPRTGPRLASPGVLASPSPLMKVSQGQPGRAEGWRPANPSPGLWGICYALGRTHARTHLTLTHARGPRIHMGPQRHRETQTQTGTRDLLLARSALYG